MYDLDNGTENIKVKDITCNKITAVTSAITTEYDALVINGVLTVKGWGSEANITIGSEPGGHPDYIKSNSGLDLIVEDVTVASLNTHRLALNRVLKFAKYSTIERPFLLESYNGSVIYDTTLGKLILWNGTAWVNLDGTSLGE